MKDIILKKYPEKYNFFEYLFMKLKQMFKEREFFFMYKGKFISYKISAFLQVFVFFVLILLFSWIIFTSKFYIKNTAIEKNKVIELDNAKTEFNKLVSEIYAYKDNITDIYKKIQNFYASIEIANNKDKKEIDKLSKQKFMLFKELEYANKSFDKYIKQIGWHNGNFSKEFYKNARAELAKNIIIDENINLKKENKILEKAVVDMTTLQQNLIDKVNVLADGNLKSIEKTLSKIDVVLSGLNLKDRKNLIAKVSKENGSGIGGIYVPLKNITLKNKSLNEKFINLNAKVNLWDGLSRAKTMLPLGAPVKKLQITSHYGVRNDPFLNVAAMHTGIDFAGKIGTSLYSTSAGKVIYAGGRGDYGLAVEVDHGMGFSTLYAHLSKISVKKGDIIDEGDRVGLAGSTGRSTGPHLHYEIRYNKRPFNPYSFVKTEK